METILRSWFRDRIGTVFANIIVMSLAARSPMWIPKETSYVCGRTSISYFLYGDVPDVSDFSRSARSIWLEIKSNNVEEMRQKILASGLVRKLEVPDLHLYFQAPGSQCLRLVGIDENLSFYEGSETGPALAKIKEALKKEAMKDHG